MTTFYFDGQMVDAQPEESVLDALIRNGNQVNYSCKKGSCKICLVKYIEGELSTGAQRGLTTRLKQDDYLCSCQCKPTDGLKLSSVLAQDLFIPAQLLDKHYLTESIVRLQLNISEPAAFQAGHYVNVRRFDGLTRSYSIAGHSHSIIELDIRRKYNGQLSDWLFNHASIGDGLLVQGPFGSCNYSKRYRDDTLVLIGSGTGAGAMHGIVTEALSSGHRGKICLYHGAPNSQELYLHSALLKLMMEQRNFSYLGCVENELKTRECEGSRVKRGDLFDVAMEQHDYQANSPLAKKYRIYLCGEPDFVTKGQKSLFLSGLPMDRVHVLSFDYKDLRKVERQ